jgi:hypothetical protein
MKLILDTLERARLAASPAEALDVADALTDLEALADALARNGWTLSDAPAALDDFAAVVNHVRAQPFEVADDLLTQGDVVRGPIIDETAPDAFADWLGELERLAQ